MTLRLLLVLIALAAFIVPQDATDEPTEAQRRSRSYWMFEAPLPSAEELAADPSAHEELLSEHGLVLDIENGVVRARAGVIHDKISLTYPIEYLIVTDKGQVHESIFMVRARPLLVNRCLEAIGLVAGAGMSYDYTNENRTAWVTQPAHGELVDIMIEWIDDDGRQQAVPLEDMLIDLASGEPLEGRGWIYVGSRWAQIRRGLEDVERYLADIEGNLAAIYLDGRGACLFERNSMQGVDTPYTLHPEKVPPRETSVTITFRPTGTRVDPGEAIPGGIVLAGGPDAKRHDELEHEYDASAEWDGGSSAHAVALGAGSELLVARADRIDVIDGTSGAVLRSLDTGADAIHALAYRATEDGGVVWCATADSTRVMAVDAMTGAVLSTLTPPSDGWRPADVAVSEDGAVFVSDGAAGIVRRFDAQGAQDLAIGEPGDRLGQFTSPSGLVIDTRGRYPHLLVADRDGRIQAFDLDGRYLAVVARRLQEPVSLSIRGRFLAVAEAAGRVTILDELDRPVATIGMSEEEGAISCTAPQSAAWNTRGDLFVVDGTTLRRLDRREPPSDH